MSAPLKSLGFTPSPPVQCGLAQVRWENSVGHSIVDILRYDGGTESLHLRFDPQPNMTNSLTWYPVNVAAGSSIAVRVADAGNQTDTSDRVVVAAGDANDPSCLQKEPMGATPGSLVSNTNVPTSSSTATPTGTSGTSGSVTSAPSNSGTSSSSPSTTNTSSASYSKPPRIFSRSIGAGLALVLFSAVAQVL